MSILRFVLSATLVCLATSPVLGQTYYATSSGGFSPVPFGKIDASGSTTPIGGGLNFGTGVSSANPSPELLVAPNGTLYAFDASIAGNFGPVGPWGTVNPTTGVFTKIGDLSSVFTGTANGGPVLGFDSAGDLIAAGYSNNMTPIFGTLNLTNGAFTSTANASMGDLLGLAETAYDAGGMGHIVTVPNQGTYYATSAGGYSPVPFGKIDASGSTTPIGGGLNFGTGVSSANPSPELLVAPNGTLYAFDASIAGNFGPVGPWGAVNPTTGVFTKIGDLSSVFTGTANGGPVLGFDSAGDLIAAGYSDNMTPIFGTLNLTTGAFTSTANASTGDLLGLAETAYDAGGMGHIVTIVPEPSVAVLLATGLLTLAGCAFARRRRLATVCRMP